MPIDDLIKVCRKHDVLVLVDGAHTPGQVQLNLEQLGADFYVGWYLLEIWMAGIHSLNDNYDDVQYVPS